METRETMTHSQSSGVDVKMNASLAFLLCGVVGSVLGYYNQVPYNVGPNDPYSVAVGPNYIQEPSQRLFWDKFGNSVQGSNQVGQTGFWGMLSNKFPFLSSMFGRLEVPQIYGVPPQYPQFQGAGTYSAQYYRTPYSQQQIPQQFGRDVGFTDDAVIVTPPHVPIAPQPAPAQPAPVPEPSPAGYRYNKPQYSLELPHK